MGGEATRQPSSVINNAAVPVLASIIATVAAGNDIGTATDPRAMLQCTKATRLHGIRLLCRGTATGMDGTNTCVIKVYPITAAGVVGSAMVTKTLIANPAAVGKAGIYVDLGALDSTLRDIAAGGCIGIFIDQTGTSDLFAGQNVEVHTHLSAADDTTIVGN